RSLFPAFAPLRLLRGFAIHAGVDVARAPARAEIGIVPVGLPATALVARGAVLADNSALRGGRSHPARHVGAEDRGGRQRSQPKAHHSSHLNISPATRYLRPSIARKPIASSTWQHMLPIVAGLIVLR